MKQAPILLTDEQMQAFITKGYVVLKTDFEPDFHAKLMDELNHVYEEEGNPGNNLLPRVPKLRNVFNHPAVDGALQSVIGPNYLMHTHRHGHFNAAPEPGGWHKDSYWGYNRMRNHHPWWAMIMYFPQNTPPELGPTSVMPGTQNYASRIFIEDEMKEEVLASGEAGTFILIHYDIWHRATANTLGQPRYMLKFEFMRTEAPVAPSWNNENEEWKTPSSANELFYQHEEMWNETWDWLSGKVGAIAETRKNSDVAKLSALLIEDNEPEAINAAYQLAASGDDGISELEKALHSTQLKDSRVAAYGLSVAGEKAIPILEKALESNQESTIVNAVFALGELRYLSSPVVRKLNELVNHPSLKVRHVVVDALGMIQEPTEEVLAGLIRALKDEDIQTRFTAGLALCHFGTEADVAVPHLAEALKDEDRYVRGHAVEALNYINTDAAKEVLIDYLLASRWCASTTPASTF
ncbi:HEAT repeat domain-containing protein [Sporosarcina sp. E16_3]|uniref:HEAT repeat domain-containing protein n=1 Tax=Sporosarcina sp. E16_3 TaxID=2789293 RepID=UPI001A927091|nr:HEAT repeat domain-containing protein [Sporosarcina sp. E16_3]MBO0600644.1 HEAT repeat domain-containing protein [Sporosarcina sp. E16_3]